MYWLEQSNDGCKDRMFSFIVLNHSLKNLIYIGCRVAGGVVAIAVAW